MEFTQGIENYSDTKSRTLKLISITTLLPIARFNTKTLFFFVFWTH